MSKGLLRSASIFSVMTLISRISGLIRDQVYAMQFGASPAMDAFLVAFRIPNFMRRISAEGAFSMVFVPVLQEYRAKATPTEVRELIDKVAGTLTAGLVVLTAAGVLAAPWVMRVFAPGFAPGSEQFALAAELLRITFPYILLISLSAMVGGILNSYGNFAIPALTPVLMNLAMIFAALVMAPMFAVPVTALAWGVFAAGVLQLAFQLPSLAKLGLLPRLKFGFDHAGVRKILKLMGPTLFGSSVAQVNLLLNTVIATFLFAGSVTWLYYSDRLLEFPLGIFGVAVGTVILPHLAKQHASENHDGYSRGLDWGFQLCLLIGIPACVGLMLCAKGVLATLFMYGKFNELDLRMTTLSLVCQAIAIPAFLLVKVLAPAFYSRQDTRTPVKAAVSSIIVNIVSLALLIWGVMHFTDAGRAAMASDGSLFAAMGQVPGLHATLACAIALAGWANALQLGWSLRKAKIYSPGRDWLRFLRIVVLATVVMALVVAVFAWRWDAWAQWSPMQRAWRLVTMVGTGGVTYFAMLWLQGLRPADLKGH